jgi:3-oxoacyl-[acyl-carrier-protein] synthase III
MSPGALELADTAARACLSRAHRTADELDLLINAGVYHDRVLSEPAFAALIQEDIGANPNQLLGASHGTFSFDVCNGACGLLTGIQLVDGMLASGTAKLGMVVASDMNPEPDVSRGFGFPAVGGAVLLSADASRAGFTAFQSATFPEYAELFQSYVSWQDDAGRGLDHRGRNLLTVEIAESYAGRALDCAEATARELSAAQAVDLGAVDLLVATASVRGFADSLARRLGVSAERVASPSNGVAGAHTAAPALALESVRLEEARTTLFVSAGAGITVAAAIYRA